MSALRIVQVGSAMPRLIRRQKGVVREPAGLAGSDAPSSQPAALDSASHFGVPKNVVSFEFPHGISVTAVAEIASLVGDPARLNMLLALLDGFPMTARDLAERAGVTAQTASSHLGKLRMAGLLRVEQRGRQRFHSLATTSAVRMLACLGEVAVEAGCGHTFQEKNWPDAGIGFARICNGHMAGRLAVALTRRLLDENTGTLSREGQKALLDWGIDCSTTVIAPGCFDWSERVDHVSGLIGTSILKRALELNWVKHIPGRRTLVVTGIGIRGFQSHFGIDSSDLTRQHPSPN